MKKIPTIFERDWNGDRSRVLDQPNPAADWVFRGEGLATIKLDGTSCLVRAGRLFKRRELRKGDAVPSYFEMADHDDETGKTVGWVPVGEGPDDKYHRLAWGRQIASVADGTYELIGPKVQGNPERVDDYRLVAHGSLVPERDPPRAFVELRGWLATKDIEGLVWHHPDGRMAKIKLRDFGLKRPA